MDVDPLARPVERHRPDERRSLHSGEQAGRAFGEHGRIEPRVPVRGVERLAAAMGLRVELAAGLHERGDVRDRVAHAIALAVPLEVHRLVEVHRRRRVDGDERDVRLVRPRPAMRTRCPLRLRDDGVGEAGRHAELPPELCERRGDLRVVRVRQANLALGHGSAYVARLEVRRAVPPRESQPDCGEPARTPSWGSLQSQLPPEELPA